MKRGLNIVLTLLFGALLTGLFTLNFTDNLFNLGVPHNPRQWQPTDFSTFQADSEMSVTLMMEKTKRNGLMSTGGFMMVRDINEPPYFSAWGLQGKILSFFYHFSDEPLAAFMTKAQTGVAVLFGLLLAAFVLYCRREFGWITAGILTLGLLWSDWMVFAGRNTYLVYFVHLLPMILGWTLFPLFQRAKGFNWYGYLAVVGGATLLNALCYFDYSSNIVLSTAAGPLYYGCKEGWPTRKIIRGMMLTLIVSAAAVAVAIAATAIQAGIWFGSLSEGFNQVLCAATSRMYGSSQLSKAAPDSISILAIFNQYLTIPALTLPWLPKGGYYVFLSFFAFLSFGLTAVVAILMDRHYFISEANRRKMTGLGWAVLWGMAATLSWMLLMKGHMFHHPHMNGMLFYLPYMTLLYVLLGAVLEVPAKRFLKWLTGSLTGK